MSTLPTTLPDWLALLESRHAETHIDMGLDRVRTVKERMGLAFSCPLISTSTLAALSISSRSRAKESTATVKCSPAATPGRSPTPAMSRGHPVNKVLRRLNAARRMRRMCR